MNLESKKTIVEKSAKDLFALLENVANFERLMPDNISKFQMLSEQSFVFALKGMPEISLEKKSSTPSSQLVLGEAKVRFLFSLLPILRKYRTMRVRYNYFSRATSTL